VTKGRASYLQWEHRNLEVEFGQRTMSCDLLEITKSRLLNLSWIGRPKVNVDDSFWLICLHADRGGSQMKRLHMQRIIACKLQASILI